MTHEDQLSDLNSQDHPSQRKVLGAVRVEEVETSVRVICDRRRAAREKGEVSRVEEGGWR